jgi:class 3 adenylate cyclase
METVRQHHEAVRECAEAHGGTVVETQGDGALLAFGSARRAVSCAKDIQAAVRRDFADASPPIRVRIGIHTGDALHEADRFFGTTVNYAARVASHALGGEVLVSNVVHQLVSDSDIEFLESRDVELKGIEGSHRLFAVDLA